MTATLGLPSRVFRCRRRRSSLRRFQHTEAASRCYQSLFFLSLHYHVQAVSSRRLAEPNLDDTLVNTGRRVCNPSPMGPQPAGARLHCDPCRRAARTGHARRCAARGQSTGRKKARLVRGGDATAWRTPVCSPAQVRGNDPHAHLARHALQALAQTRAQPSIPSCARLETPMSASVWVALIV